VSKEEIQQQDNLATFSLCLLGQELEEALAQGVQMEAQLTKTKELRQVLRLST